MALDPFALFGKLVAGQIEEHPNRARRLFSAGLTLGGIQQRYFLNKQLPKSKQYLCFQSLQAVLQPLKHPARTAIVNIFLPCELLQAMDVRPQIAEGLSCYLCGTKCEQAFLEYAHARGVPETLCSYHRVLAGMALSDVLPKPLLIANTTMACDANIQNFRFLAAHYGVPHFTVDVPYEDSPQASAYVAEQLRALGSLLQEVCGTRLDENALCECVARSQRSLAQYHTYLGTLSGKFLPNELTAEMCGIFATHVLLGTPEAERYFTMLAQDANNAPGFRTGNRILWVHSMPYWQESIRSRLNFSEKYQILCSDLTLDNPLVTDTDDPYEIMARRILRNSFNGDFERRGQVILARAKQLHANGIIYFCHWGCRNTEGAAQLMKQMADAAGIPILLLDGDGCDRSNINDGQMLTRLEAFLELLEGTK